MLYVSYVLLALLGVALWAAGLSWLDLYFSRKRFEKSWESIQSARIASASRLAVNAWQVQRSLTFDPATQKGWYECQEAKTAHALAMLTLARELGMPEPTIERV